MAGVLEGFAVIGVVIAVGYLLGRFDLLGPGARLVLNRFVFFVAAPALHVHRDRDGGHRGAVLADPAGGRHLGARGRARSTC